VNEYRYEVTSFPGRYGNPYDTNSAIAAWAATVWRCIFWCAGEVRLRDRKTGLVRVL